MYKKGDTTGLPEGTDWNTLFEFRMDDVNWTKPMRCLTYEKDDYFKYQASDKRWYKQIRPVTQWEPVPGEVYLFWDDGDEYPTIKTFGQQISDRFFTDRGGPWQHIARIDHVTKVPTSVDELKELAGEDWL